MVEVVAAQALRLLLSQRAAAAAVAARWRLLFSLRRFCLMRSRLRLARVDRPDFRALRALRVMLAEVDCPHKYAPWSAWGRLWQWVCCMSAAASQGAAVQFLPLQPLEALARPLIRVGLARLLVPGIRPLARQALAAQPTAPHGKAAAQAVVVVQRPLRLLVAVRNGAAVAVALVGITTQRLLLSRPLLVD